MDWISVKDRLPEQYEDCNCDNSSNHVLIYTECEDIQIGYLVTFTDPDYEDCGESGWFIFQIADDHPITEVTHWMPLPGAPISDHH
jgi:hypothetical protein